MAEVFMILGFAMAAYAIVANDSIQTLGTFLASNAKRPWWVLWIWISGIMVVTVTWGWLANGGDPAFGRLAAKQIDLPNVFTWLFILPPLCLVILTRMGIPVSTSLLVLTGFKALVAQQQGEDAKGAVELFSSMMQKSLVGYGIAFVLGLVIFMGVLYIMERKVKADIEAGDKNDLHPVWTVFQWISTGFLWSMWLVQDLANIFVYLPRELTWWGLALSLGGMVLLQGYLFKEKGGKIQRVVTSKTNTLDVRSATFIDFFYGIVLLLFKMNGVVLLFDMLNMERPWEKNLPMSTTWVFLGLLAGREIGIAIRLRHRDNKKVSTLVFSDAGKAFFGSVIAIALAMILPILAGGKIDPPADEKLPEATVIETRVEGAVEAAAEVIEEAKVSAKE